MKQLLNRLSRSMVCRRLDQIPNEQIRVSESSQEFQLGSRSGDCNLRIAVANSDFYRKTLFAGALGAAESYLDGDWDCNDLTGLIRCAARNINTFDRLSSTTAWARKQTEWITNRNRRNTIKQAKNNIHEHYDLGNEFFASFLDPTLSYSSGIFQRPDDSMMLASLHKLWQVCTKLELSGHDHLLEIGTGWGGLAIFAARHFGCKVTTTTISEEQYRFAVQRVKQAGLQDRIRVLKRDYRDLDGVYDKIVSIEMIEAVGHEYLDTFFDHCDRLLSRDGSMLLQSITIRDERHDLHVRNVDFIKKYIFPGGCLPSNQSLLQSIERASQLQVQQLTDIGLHYAQTLSHWKALFEKQKDRLPGRLNNERFRRMWNYYLCYCQAGFLERQISNVHLLLTPRTAVPRSLPAESEMPRQQLIMMAQDWLNLIPPQNASFAHRNDRSVQTRFNSQNLLQTQ